MSGNIEYTVHYSNLNQAKANLIINPSHQVSILFSTKLYTDKIAIRIFAP